MKILNRIIIAFFAVAALLGGCSDCDDVDDPVQSGNTPPAILSYLRSSEGGDNVATDPNGAAIDPKGLMVRFKNPAAFPTDQDKRDVIEALFGAANISTIEFCMCGDQLILTEFNQGFLDAEGGIEGVKKLAGNNEGDIETEYNYFVYNDRRDVSAGTNTPIPTDLQANPAGVIIAVLDTGIDGDPSTPYVSDRKIYQTPPDVVDDCIAGDDQYYDFVNEVAFSFDDNAHGTHVTGIVYDESERIIELTEEYDYSILPLKTHNRNGNGFLFDALCGTYYAVDEGASVINDSWGFYGLPDSDFVERAMNYANANNVTIVSSTGNLAVDIATAPHYPSSLSNFPNVIGVGAYFTDVNGSVDLTSFTNFNSNEPVNLMAPGQGVSSTIPQWAGGGTAPLSGTSMAAPHITAYVAYLYGTNQVTTPTQVKSLLSSKGTVVTINNEDYKFYSTDTFVP